eukprot:1785691-Pyramimonas_sp.AAC.1
MPGACGPAPGMAGAAQPSCPVPRCVEDKTSAPASAQCPLLATDCPLSDFVVVWKVHRVAAAF